MALPLMPNLTDEDMLARLARFIDDYKVDHLPPSHGRLSRNIGDYQADAVQPAPQLAAVLCMAALKADWGGGPLDFKKMQADVKRVVDIVSAFAGQVALLDAMKNGLPDDEDD